MNFRSISLKSFRRVISFRFHWSSEIYSFGKIYRRWLKVPHFFPLLFTSDHGVNLGRAVDPNIFMNPNYCLPHLSWNSHIIEATDFPKRFRRIGIVHPWAYWRMYTKTTPDPLESRKGSVVFISHSSGGSSTVGYNDQQIIEYLDTLPEILQPVSICVFYGDLFRQARLKVFTQHGFRIVTVGDPWSPNFVDNFYSLLANKRLLISQSYGSQIPLASEFGIPVVLIGQEIMEVDDESQLPKEYTSENADLLSLSTTAVKALFKEFGETPTQVQLEWARDKLGFRYLPNMKTVRRKLILVSFLFLPFWFISETILGNLRRILTEILRKLRPKRNLNS